MNVNQVRNAIFRTECKNLIRDGLCCSEPIMTRDEKGVIDHYFIYGINREEKTFSGPVASFGIYSESRETAYISASQTRKYSKSPEDEIRAVNWGQYDENAYGRYEETFPLVRDFVYRTHCTEEQKAVLRKYIEALRALTDDGMWPLYRELAPGFFNWAKTVLE